MTKLLLTAQEPPLPVGDDADPRVDAAPGPAVLLSPPADTGESGAAPADVPHAHDVKSALANRPIAYREAGADWHVLGYEAADHWENLSPALRERLIADRTAQVSVAEYSATTDGASASMITNNWVHSGSPRMYRIAGELRELAEVVSELS